MTEKGKFTAAGEPGCFSQKSHHLRHLTRENLRRFHWDCFSDSELLKCSNLRTDKKNSHFLHRFLCHKIRRRSVAVKLFLGLRH